MRKKLCLFSAVMLGTVVAAGTATAQNVTVSVGEPVLSRDRVSVSVPVTVTCTPFDPSLTHFQSSVNVGLQQAAGRQIASGSASAFSSLPDLFFQCNGTEYTFAVPVLANTAGPPFRHGWAAVTAQASASAGIPCSPGSTNCFFNVTNASGSAGPVALRVR